MGYLPLILLLLSVINFSYAVIDSTNSSKCTGLHAVSYVIDNSGSLSAAEYEEMCSFALHAGRIVLESNSQNSVSVVGFSPSRGCSGSLDISNAVSSVSVLQSRLTGSRKSTCSNGPSVLAGLTQAISLLAQESPPNSGNCPGKSLKKTIVIVGAHWYDDLQYRQNATLVLADNSAIEIITMSVANHTLYSLLAKSESARFRARNVETLYRFIGLVSEKTLGREDLGFACTTTGTSHVYTFDGATYSFQGIGDYYLMKNKKNESGASYVDIQVRLDVCSEVASRGVSCVRAIGVRWWSVASQRNETITVAWSPSGSGHLDITRNGNVKLVASSEGTWCMGSFDATKVSWRGSWFEIRNIGGRATSIVGEFTKEGPAYTYIQADYGFHEQGGLNGVRGLCGLYDGCIKNDLTDNEGNVRPLADAFGFGTTYLVPSENKFIPGSISSVPFVPRVAFPSGANTKTDNCNVILGSRPRQICDYDILASGATVGDSISPFQTTTITELQRTLSWICYEYCANNGTYYAQAGLKHHDCSLSCGGANDQLLTTESHIEMHDLELHFKGFPPHHIVPQGHSCLDATAKFYPTLLGGKYTIEYDAGDFCSNAVPKTVDVSVVCDKSPVISITSTTSDQFDNNGRYVFDSHTSFSGGVTHSAQPTQDDSDQVAYSWAFVSFPGLVAPQITGRTGLQASWTPNAIGTYIIEVAIYDGCSIGKDNVSVTVICGQCWPDSSIIRQLPQTTIDFGGILGIAGATVPVTQPWTPYDLGINRSFVVSGAPVSWDIVEFQPKFQSVPSNWTVIRNSAGSYTLNIDPTETTRIVSNRGSTLLSRTNVLPLDRNSRTEGSCNADRPTVLDVIFLRANVNITTERNFCKLAISSSGVFTAIMDYSSLGFDPANPSLSWIWYPEHINCEGRYKIKMTEGNQCYTNQDEVWLDVRCGPKPIARAQCQQTASPWEVVELQHCDSYDPRGRPIALRWEVLGLRDNTTGNYQPLASTHPITYQVGSLGVTKAVFESTFARDVLSVPTPSRSFSTARSGTYGFRLHVTNGCNVVSEDFTVVVNCDANEPVQVRDFTHPWVSAEFNTLAANNNSLRIIPHEESTYVASYSNKSAVYGGLPVWGAYGGTWNDTIRARALYMNVNTNITVVPPGINTFGGVTVPLWGTEYPQPTYNVLQTRNNMVFSFASEYRLTTTATDDCTEASKSYQFEVQCEDRNNFDAVYNNVIIGDLDAQQQQSPLLLGTQYSWNLRDEPKLYVPPYVRSFNFDSNGITGTLRVDVYFGYFTGQTLNRRGVFAAYEDDRILSATRCSDNNSCRRNLVAVITNTTVLTGSVQNNLNDIRGWRLVAVSNSNARYSASVSNGPSDFTRHGQEINIDLSAFNNRGEYRIELCLGSNVLGSCSNWQPTTATITVSRRYVNGQRLYTTARAGIAGLAGVANLESNSFPVLRFTPSSSAVSSFQGLISFQGPCTPTFIHWQGNLSCANSRDWGTFNFAVVQSPDNSVSRNWNDVNLYYIKLETNTHFFGGAVRFTYQFLNSTSVPIALPFNSTSNSTNYLRVRLPDSGIYVIRFVATDGCDNNTRTLDHTIQSVCPTITGNLNVNTNSVAWNPLTYRFDRVWMNTTTDGYNPWLRPNPPSIVTLTTSSFFQIEDVTSPLIPVTTAYWWVDSAPPASIFAPTADLARPRNFRDILTRQSYWYQTGFFTQANTRALAAKVRLLASADFRYIETNTTDKHIYPWAKNVFGMCFRPDVPGEYVLKLRLHHCNGGDKVETVNLTATCPTINSVIKVNSTVPIILNTITYRGDGYERVTLDGTDSTIGGGPVNSFLWSLSKPAASSAVLVSSTSCITSFIPDHAGNYTFTLTIDSGCSTQTVTRTITVLCSSRLSITSLEVTNTASHDWDRHFNLTRYQNYLLGKQDNITSWRRWRVVGWEPLNTLQVVSPQMDPDLAPPPTLAPTPVPSPLPVVIPTPVPTPSPCCCNNTCGGCGCGCGSSLGGPIVNVTIQNNNNQQT